MDATVTKTNYHWAALLVMLISSMIIESLFGVSPIADLISLALVELTIIGSIFFGLQSLRWRIACGIVSLFWFATSLFAMNTGEMDEFLTALTALLVLGAPAVTLNTLLRSNDVDFETLTGAIFWYLLLAVVWAMLYFNLVRSQPDAIFFETTGGLWSTMVYFSLVTQTSLGYGDILPLDPFARIMAGLQAVVGVLYVAVLIGGIVGAFRSEKS